MWRAWPAAATAGTAGNGEARALMIAKTSNPGYWGTTLRHQEHPGRDSRLHHRQARSHGPIRRPLLAMLRTVAGCGNVGASDVDPSVDRRAR